MRIQDLINIFKRTQGTAMDVLKVQIVTLTDHLCLWSGTVKELCLNPPERLGAVGPNDWTVHQYIHVAYNEEDEEFPYWNRPIKISVV